jgi:hypothetical protein
MSDTGWLSDHRSMAKETMVVNYGREIVETDVIWLPVGVRINRIHHKRDSVIRLIF